ncbi:MAG: DUF4007 family protein [Lachnospiraceae bacterium]|jgi:hypothetical protein|nr:DUF4007 family protein [Lachnospiraceae bacterium]
MEHPVRFKGHESFIIREGWLNKGLREVKRDPKVFYQNYGADALGVGPNMAKSIRYWLKCSGLTDEGVRSVVRLTELGEMVLKNDPYFEDIFSLWVVHCNIARNRRQATSWQLFFNEFEYEEFTKEELEQKMAGLAYGAAEGQNVPTRSVKEDCEAILRMYTKKPAKGVNPEEKNVSPFGVLGLLKQTEEGYAKSQPRLDQLPAEIALYLMAGKMGRRRAISIEDLLSQRGGPGKILHLKRNGLMELLGQLAWSEEIALDQTAGLDMVYLPEGNEPGQIVQRHYSGKEMFLGKNSKIY